MSLTPQEALPCIKTYKFTTIPRARRLINQQTDRLLADTSRAQYLLFAPINTSQFNTLDEGRFDSREIIPKNTRLSYNATTSTLTVKLMASPKHETAAILLTARINSKVESLGLPSTAFVPTGAARRQGKYVSKQPDGSFKPFSRGEGGWPTLTIEAGMSESLVKLRRDAAWWLTNSGGQVHIALIASLQKDDRSIVMETWEMMVQPQTDETRRVTRSKSQPSPALKQEITIPEVGEVRGGPLVLGFEKLLERQPQQGEGDVVLSLHDLRSWADAVWTA
ncbi:hypothetical protein V491_05666 [Pseudogymnoascus sp. VKM F-3775]|nr:hypothetical protein V491_05666 [Pseudogymnoascus sp. VKM F-3775]